MRDIARGGVKSKAIWSGSGRLSLKRILMRLDQPKDWALLTHASGQGSFQPYGRSSRTTRCWTLVSLILKMSVTLHTTSGDIKIEVFCESVPKTAENFLALCASGYYDGSLFHRLIPHFMIQTGAPSSQPKGGSSIWQAPFEDEIRPALRHNARGIVSMANKGPETNGSQFFISFDKAPHLDGKNTVFGHVLGDESMTTLSRMEEVEVDKKNRPKIEMKIENVTIHANPLAD